MISDLLTNLYRPHAIGMTGGELRAGAAKPRRSRLRAHLAKE